MNDFLFRGLGGRTKLSGFRAVCGVGLFRGLGCRFRVWGLGGLGIQDSTPTTTPEHLGVRL